MDLVAALRCIPLLLIGSTGLAQTVETFDRAFDVSGVPQIHVRNEDGRTQLRAHDSPTVEIRATKEVVRARSDAHAAELLREVEIRITQRGDRIEVATIYPRRGWESGRTGQVRVQVEVRAPRRSDLDIGSEDGPLSVEGFDGEIRLRAEDGNVEVSDCSGTIDIEADDGDVELVNVAGALVATLNDGDLTARARLSELGVETEDGNINLALEPGSTMGADWSVRTADGRVRLELPDDFAADLDIRVDDGHIEIDRPVTVRGAISNRELQTALNGGGHTLRVRAEDGTVAISDQRGAITPKAG